MHKGNKKKSDALGMPFGTAANRLRKMVLFSLLVKMKENFCYRCSGEILTESDLSIEHKEAWLQADNPVQSFFDLNNVTFSHLSCNVAAASKPHRQWQTEDERKAHVAKLERNRWHGFSKAEQKRIRREKYLRNGC